MNFEENRIEIDRLSKKYPVNEWRVKGVCLWPLLQIYLRDAIPKENRFSSPKKRIDGLINNWKKLKAFFSEWFLSQKTSYKESQADFVLFSFKQGRTKVNNVFHNNYVDPLASLLERKGYRALVAERVIDCLDKRLPINRKTWLIKEKGILKRISNRLTRKSKGVDNLHSSFELFCSEASDTFGVSEASISIKANVLLQIIEDSEYWERKLCAIQPKCVVVTCYYSSMHYSIILACKKLNIPVADYQHGVQGAMHLAYSGWNAISKEGYDLLPNYFLTWSNLEKNEIDKWADRTSIHKAINIGNLWVEGWKNGFYKSSEYDVFKYLKKKTNKVVLFSLQDHMPPDHIFDLVEKTEGRWLWLFRQHPGYQEIGLEVGDRVKGIANVFQRGEAQFPLPCLLSEIDFHITSFSSVVLESLCYRKPSFVCSEAGRILYEKEIGKGDVGLLTDSKQESIEYCESFKCVSESESETDSINSFMKMFD